MTTNKSLKFTISIIFTILFTVLGAQAWQGLTAENGDKLDYTKWNELVTTVQSGRISGEVVAFNLASCPTGWTEYTTARGRTVIGVGNGAGSNEVLGAIGGDKETSIKASTNPLGSNASPTEGSYIAAQKAVGGQPLFVPSTPIPTTVVNIGPGTSGNMQPYVALLYCVKN